jgi:integrase
MKAKTVTNEIGDTKSVAEETLNKVGEPANDGARTTEARSNGVPSTSTDETKVALAALTVAQRTAVLAVAGSDPGVQLRMIEALRPTWGKAGPSPASPPNQPATKGRRPPSALPAPRGGTVQKFKDAEDRSYWRGRVTLADGKRRWLEPRFSSELLAREFTAEKSAEIESQGVTLAMVVPNKKAGGGTGETCDEYFERLSEERRSEGIGRVKQEANTWRDWVSPIIGHLPIATIRRDDVENVRDALDLEVKKRRTEGLGAGICGSTAKTNWGIVRSTFKHAVSARNRALRVRADDPTNGIIAPLSTAPPTKTFIYPVELTRLLACEKVPVKWRVTYCIATYLYLRPEELKALLWSDIDFDARTVNISKSMDWWTGAPKPQPKTVAAVRDVPIEETLFPLLRAAYDARESDVAFVTPALQKWSHSGKAEQLRRHLRLAGATRPRLFARTPTLLPVNFRSTRCTGITWLALKRRKDGERELPIETMMRRCGHLNFKTTNGYVKMAEDPSGAIGDPFPPVPQALLDWLKKSK